MRKLFYALLILIVSLVIADYGLRLLQSLSFETIGAFPGYANAQSEDGPDPKLVILATAEEARAAKRFITGRGEPILASSEVDFSTHFVVIAFRGVQPTINTGFRITQVVRRGDTIALYAQPGRLPIVQPDEVSFPYHAIKVPKAEAQGQVFTFTLHFGRFKEAVASSRHFIP